jgi:hypothetical protein
MTTTNHTSPSGEDAANGAVGEREAFEALMRMRGEDYLYRRDEPGCERRGDYCRQSVQDQWEVWQARAALTAEKVAAEPVATCADGCQYSKDVGMWPEHSCAAKCIYSEASTKPIYQVENIDGDWSDVDWLTYESTGEGARRIVYAAPQASEGKGEHVAYQWKNKVFGNWVFANDIHHAEMMRQHGHETRALVVAAPQAECAPSWHGSHAATPVTTVSVTTQAECAPRDAWQPIESAPKFGEPIDVWGRYGRKSECVFGKPTYAGGLHWIYEAGYDSNGPVFEIVVDPTHWMPPPASPSAANDKEKQS